VEAGIYRRPDSHLEIGWRDAQGKQRWRVVEGGIKAARAALAQEHAKRARGEVLAADPRLTFNDAADAWWTDHVVARLRESSQRAYASDLKHLREHFGSQRLNRIGPSDVARYAATKELKGWTVKGQLAVLSGVWRYANRHLGLTAPNPVALLDRAERPKTDDQREHRILAGDELAALVAAVDARHRLIFRAASETGCRLAEALGLAWGDIDVTRQTVAFTHQLDRSGERVRLKTAKSRRVLEITAALAGEFRKHKLAAERTGAGDLVFVRRTGRGHDHRNVGGRVLARAVKASGIADPSPTFHDLRHTHASALIAAGWDIQEVSERLGHADIATTQRIYVHAFDVARRSDERRSRLTALYGAGKGSVHGSAMEASGRNRPQQTALPVKVEGPGMGGWRGTA